MKNDEYFTGIAVVIDDEYKKSETNIADIIKQIESNNMPCIKYSELPDEKIIENFGEISFLLLDWKLWGNEQNNIAEGVKIPSTLDQGGVDANIKFLKKLGEVCFIPIFIFTNEPKAEIIDLLKKNNLYKDNHHNYIFIKNKNELKGKKKLFIEIEKWVKKMPSIYTLKTWEREYRKAKRSLFDDFYRITPDWPKVLWSNFTDDGVNRSQELGELISKNLYTRMMPFEFSKDILGKRARNVTKTEIRKIIGGGRFIDKKYINPESIEPGDVFHTEGDRYVYINIRPSCDCVLRKTEDDLDTIELYLIRGSKMTKNQERKKHDKTHGIINESHSNAIAFALIDDCTYTFQFKDFSIKKWGDLKDIRKGRLLPPYITIIQQKYALYLQRQGAIRIPRKAVEKE